MSGTPKTFTRSDLDQPVTREFCENCGTHLTTRRPDLPLVILKVGTLDDPSLFGVPQMAIYTLDMQPFHIIPEGVPAFDGEPPPLTKDRRPSFRGFAPTFNPLGEKVGERIFF